MKNIFKEKYINFALWTLYVLTIVYILTSPSDSVSSALRGCELFYKSVLPSLFPFFVLSSFAINCGMDRSLGKAFGMIPKWLGVNSGEYTYIISVLSGYPTSTKTVCEGYSDKKISGRDATILLILSSNGSAAFILSYIGGNLLASNTAALILLAANYLAPIITAWLLAKRLPEKKLTHIINEETPKMSYVSGFVSAVRDSTYAVLNVGAFVVFFSVVVGMSDKISGGNDIFSLLFSPTELSNGCRVVADADIPITLKTGIISFIVGFGGICVMFQNLSFVEKTDLDKGLFVKYKLITGIISFIISYLLSTAFVAQDINVFAPAVRDPNVSLTDVNLLLLSLLAIIILYTLIDKRSDSERK